MYIGTTPKFTFPVTFPVNELSDFVLTFSQGADVVLEKTLKDCDVETQFGPCNKPQNVISVRLTVEESFMFEPARQLHIQLRALLEDGKQLVTKELTTYVYDSLYKGDLPTTTYSALYEFQSQISDKELPDEVLAVLPEDTNEYLSGEIATAIQPSETSIVTGVGMWTFIGYDNIEITIEDTDVTFIGYWSYIEK